MNAPSPDTIMFVGGLIATAAGWVWRKAHGEKQKDLLELLHETITAEVAEVLAEGSETLATIEARLTREANRLGVATIGRPFPAWMVKLAVQWGLTEFRQMVLNRDAVNRLPAQLEALGAAAETVAGAFEAKGKIPKLEIDVEIVK